MFSLFSLYHFTPFCILALPYTRYFIFYFTPDVRIDYALSVNFVSSCIIFPQKKHLLTLDVVIE